MLALQQGATDLDTRHPRHLPVYEREARPLAISELGNGLRPGSSALRGVPPRLEPAHDRGSRKGVVVRNQHRHWLPRPQ
jgi:hypothetical protein